MQWATINDGLPQHILNHSSISHAVNPCVVHHNKFVMTQESFSNKVRHEAHKCLRRTIFLTNCILDRYRLVRIGLNHSHDVVGITEVTADVDAGQLS